jgi:hypothetical protein
MARRPSTIGVNPLDAVVPPRRDEPSHGGREPEDTAPARRSVKERVTFQLPVELIERVRDAVYWTPGATMAALMEAALSDHLAKLEEHRGRPFERRGGALRTGRPIKN